MCINFGTNSTGEFKYTFYRLISSLTLGKHNIYFVLQCYSENPLFLLNFVEWKLKFQEIPNYKII
jgi:hypothetical protein